MKNKLTIIYCVIFSSVMAQNEAMVSSVDSLSLIAFEREVDPIDFYYEEGVFELNTSDKDSYFIEKRKSTIRFKVDSGILDSTFFKTEMYVDNVIPLVICGTPSTSKIDNDRYLIPYIKFRGKLIILTNHSVMNPKSMTINSGDSYIDHYILTILKLAR